MNKLPDRQRTFTWGWTQEEIDYIRYLHSESWNNVQIAMSFSTNVQAVQRVTEEGSVSRARKVKPTRVRTPSPINHGTRTGYHKHLRRKEDACDACKRANAERAKGYRKNEKNYGKPAPKLIGWRKGPGGIKVGVYANSPEEHKREMRPVRSPKD